MEWLIWLSAAVGVILLLLLLVSRFCFRLACDNRVPWIFRNVFSGIDVTAFPKGKALLDAGKTFSETAESEEWYIRSHDGLSLYGRFYPCENARGTVLLCHGYRSTGIHDFITVLPFFHEEGLNILLIDQRAMGKSEGRYVTFGLLERYDILKWTEELNRRLGDALPIILEGISMGGAAVVYAAGLPLPENVIGLIDDCGYFSAKEQILTVMKKIGIPYFPLYPLVSLWARISGHFDFTDTDGERSFRDSCLPVFFLHGAKDSFVPLEQGKKNYEACRGEKKWFLCKEADHGCSYLVEPDRCETELRDYLGHLLSGRAETAKGDMKQ